MAEALRIRKGTIGDGKIVHDAIELKSISTQGFMTWEKVVLQLTAHAGNAATTSVVLSWALTSPNNGSIESKTLEIAMLPLISKEDKSHKSIGAGE
jgi:hypothetical protein